MRTNLLYFIGAFLLAFGFKILYNNQPKSEISEVIGSEDLKSISAPIPDQISYNFDVKPILSDKCYTLPRS